MEPSPSQEEPCIVVVEGQVLRDTIHWIKSLNLDSEDEWWLLQHCLQCHEGGRCSHVQELSISVFGLF